MDNLLSDSSVESEVSDENPQPAVHYHEVAPEGAAGGIFPANDGSKAIAIEEEAVVELLNSSIVSLGSSSNPSLPCVSTLVFFDLETTGLPNFPKDPNVQITELSMIAVSRKDFEKYKRVRDLRVFNKLSLCVKPRSMISTVAAKITELNESKLHQQRTFDDCTGQLICNFIMRLPEPYCLLAHNGNIFDFPLLKAELERLKLSLPHATYTADTLLAFRSFDIFSSTARKSSGKSTSHSLGNLYHHFFQKRAPNSHKSEGDCDALLGVCHKAKNQMLPWIDKNKRLLSSFSNMW